MCGQPEAHYLSCNAGQTVPADNAALNAEGTVGGRSKV